MGFLDKLKEKRKLTDELEEKQLALDQAQAEHPELIASVRGLAISLNPAKDKNISGFVMQLMEFAGRLTRSIKPNGELTEKFAMVASPDMKSNPFIILLCFNRGFEDLEIAAVEIKAKLLAIQLGVKIRDIKQEGQEMEAQLAEEARGGRKITGTIQIGDQEGQLIEAVVNSQFQGLSAKAVLFIMLSVRLGQIEGHDEATVVKSLLNLGRAQVESMAAMTGDRISVISEERINEAELRRSIPGTNSFVVYGRSTKGTNSIS